MVSTINFGVEAELRNSLVIAFARLFAPIFNSAIEVLNWLRGSIFLMEGCSGEDYYEAADLSTILHSLVEPLRQRSAEW